MKSRRTEYSTRVLGLSGGNEDNDLWVYDIPAPDNQGTVLCSVWEPTDEERERIANGENIRLEVWATNTYPVSMSVTDEKLGKSRG